MRRLRRRPHSESKQFTLDRAQTCHSSAEVTRCWRRMGRRGNLWTEGGHLYVYMALVALLRRGATGPLRSRRRLTLVTFLDQVQYLMSSARSEIRGTPTPSLSLSLSHGSSVCVSPPPLARSSASVHHADIPSNSGEPRTTHLRCLQSADFTRAAGATNICVITCSAFRMCTATSLSLRFAPQY